jgi:cell division transport system permease protein
VKKSASYVYSTIGVALVLFLLGTIGWLFINGISLSNVVKGNVQLQVIMHDNTRPEKAKQLQAILSKQTFTAKVSYTSKEDALKKYIREKDEDPTTFLDLNPLYISIDLNLKPQYVVQDSINKIQQFIMQSNIVREVVYDKVVVESLDKNLKKIGIILGVIAIILFIAVVFIIDNTVRLAMFSNRHLIKTMQMVGATRWFIARPFTKKAVTSGVISSLIAIIGIFALIYFAQRVIPELTALQNILSISILVICIILLGVLISVFSTYRSVIKYLKMKVDELY